MYLKDNKYYLNPGLISFGHVSQSRMHSKLWSCVVFSDDGKLSFDEFNAYFADGILTTEELQELFYSIDGRQNKYVPSLWFLMKLEQNKTMIFGGFLRHLIHRRVL